MKRYLLILLGLVLINQAQAQPMKIDWQDLQGKVAPYYDPFDDLTEEQLYQLSLYSRVTEMEKLFPSYNLTAEMLKEAKDAKDQLIKDNYLRGFVSSLHDFVGNDMTRMHIYDFPLEYHINNITITIDRKKSEPLTKDEKKMIYLQSACEDAMTLRLKYIKEIEIFPELLLKREDGRTFVFNSLSNCHNNNNNNK